MLAAVLDQSVDCVKLIGLDGSVRWMNANGMCSMEIDDFCAVDGQQWTDLWPDEASIKIRAGLVSAAAGNVARFDAFCPTMKGTDKYWNVCISRITDANNDHSGYLAISRDMTEMVQSRQAAEIAVDEMQHRIKNTYAMVGGLLMAYSSGNPETAQFSREMQKRLVAISKAQTLFAGKQAPCDIAELIPALVAPFGNPKCVITISDIPALYVDQGRADAIALVLGELAVNATKHGALAAGGSIVVDAGRHAERLVVRWKEQSAKPVSATARSGGQGLKLIDGIVRARSGTLDINWQTNGPEVTLAFPLTA